MDYEQSWIGKLIDPPSGWQYGFPKVFAPYTGETLAGWLFREGYPKKDLELALKYSRIIG